MLTFALCKETVNIVNTDLIETGMLLDLFEVGYKNAYVSVMDLYSRNNEPLVRIETILPNVGRLCLYQTFDEKLDEQIPEFKVFCSCATAPRVIKKIKNANLLHRAVHIIYMCRDYFASHIEHTLYQNQDLINRLNINQKIAMRSYNQHAKTYNRFLNSLIKQK